MNGGSPMFELIRTLVNAYGATGREKAVSEVIESLVKPHVDSISRDALGNLICVKKGTDENGKKIMLSAHMDHIGFIVVAVEKEGFLRVMPVGGIGLNVSKTRHVSFENGVQGIIVQQPVNEGETPAMKHMFIDIGAESDEEALSMIQLGDVAVYSNDCFRLGKNRVSAPAMDDRIACALLVSVLQNLPETKNTVYAVFSTQEEVGCRGAKVAAFGIEPDVGIALDVTANGDTPETKLPAVKLGAGAAVKIMDRGSISNPDLVNELLDVGKRAGVPTQREVLPFGGTDASAIQLSRSGVKAGTVSIPCRYVHSACEVIDLRDVEACKGLLLEYLK
ncbi:MAG: M42 family metallopeptidase [Clostridiales bacterium]|nr:M42 family metallopeptidase [Clostridiales bacterium]